MGTVLVCTAWSVYCFLFTKMCKAVIFLLIAVVEIAHAVQPPSAATNVSTRALPGLGIEVSWDPPADPHGEIVGYMIVMYDESSGKTVVRLHSKAKNIDVFDGLKPSTNYTLK